MLKMWFPALEPCQEYITSVSISDLVGWRTQGFEQLLYQCCTSCDSALRTVPLEMVMKIIS